jgi:hypothetical protein
MTRLLRRRLSAEGIAPGFRRVQAIDIGVERRVEIFPLCCHDGAVNVARPWVGQLAQDVSDVFEKEIAHVPLERLRRREEVAELIIGKLEAGHGARTITPGHEMRQA